MEGTLRELTDREREVIVALDALKPEVETDHYEADKLARSVLHPDVEAAYRRVMERSVGWYWC